MTDPTTCDGIPMLPTSAPTVCVVEDSDDCGAAMWMITIRASGSEITVGRRRTKEAAESDAAELRDALPGIDS